MKIIFISRPTFFTPMRERLFLKDELDKYKIEYWSTYYLYNKINVYSYLENSEEKIKTVILRDKKELEKKFLEVDKEDIIITMEQINYANYNFFKKLYEKNIKIIFFYPENIPGNYLYAGFYKNIMPYFSELKDLKIFFQKAKNKILKSIYRKRCLNLYKKMENITFLISGQIKEKEIIKNIKSKNNIIPIMSRDLLKYKESEVREEKQIIFIDQDLVNHPDLELKNEKGVNPSLYYKYLNDFFEKIEKKYRMNIVIAAHPSSRYIFNPFNNRKIIKNNTINEIKRSKYILGHYSTSLGVVTIEKKPLILINMDIFSLRIKNYICCFGKELGIIPVNLSSFNNVNIEFEKNEDFYEKYYKNYLYQGKEEISIPINKILDILNKKGLN